MFAGASRGDKAKQLELQDAILSCEDANPILEIVGASLDGFSAINGVTALYRISRCLTSRAGRLRRKEASFVVADRRFKDLVEFVESHARALDRVARETSTGGRHVREGTPSRVSFSSVNASAWAASITTSSVAFGRNSMAPHEHRTLRAVSPQGFAH